MKFMRFEYRANHADEVNATVSSASPSPVAPHIAQNGFALAKAFDGAHTYVLERQSPGGGFCFYRNEYLDEPNLSDTWHAVAVLAQVFRVEIPQRVRHAAFVSDLPIQSQAFALQDRVRTLQYLGCNDPRSDAIRAAVAALPLRASAPDAQRSLSSELAAWKAILWLKQHFDMEVAVGDLSESLLSQEHPDGGFGTPPNLLDTEAAIDVLDLCGCAPAQRTRDFVKRMAVPSFGFRLTAHSLSPNLETTCAGVSLCDRLGMQVPYADDALGFILSCETGNGGFARSSGALPDLSLTHLALSALMCLTPTVSFDEVGG